MTQVQRAIQARERGIDRMEKEIAGIAKRAFEQTAAIRKRIASKKVLLDALKRGELKP